MNVTLFGATGALGRECLQQSLAAGHTLTVLVRTPAKLSAETRNRITVVEGDALKPDDVAGVVTPTTEAVLFAIGIDKHSPEDLCTDVTRNILAAVPAPNAPRLIWCGGGSTLVEDDQITFGAKFVEGFAATFMGLRHRDKAHQLELLNRKRDVSWIGIRPLQMRNGPKRSTDGPAYRLGFDAFSGLSKIHFADCAHAMVHMLKDDTWLHKAPIVQY